MKDNEMLYNSKVHFLGRITLLITIILILVVPIILYVFREISPPAKNLISGIISVSAFMIPLSVAEILSFYPILGNSGMYMAYTTGNISNLKLPSATIGMEAANVKSSTKEGEVISTIAMAGSVIVCEIILVIGVILIVPISSCLENEVIKPAFEQILPALFGSLGAYFILKNWKLSVIPILIGIIASFFNVPTAISVPICVLFSILTARLLYKKDMVSA